MTNPTTVPAEAMPTALALEMLKGCCQILGGVEPELRRLTKADRTFSAIGFAIDPTLFRKMLHSKTYKANVEMAEATLVFLGAARAWFEAQGAVLGEDIGAIADGMEAIADGMRDAMGGTNV